MIYRAIDLIELDHRLEISAVTALRLQKHRMIHLDELEDGTWRMTYNCIQIPDLTLVKGFSIADGKLSINGIEQYFDIKVVPVRTDAHMIHMDEGKDGRWKLMYNKDQFPEFGKVREMSLVRED